MFGSGVEHSCLRREDRQLGAYPALSLSLSTAQDKGSPSDLTAKYLTPGEGGEPLPCSVSALDCVPELCSPSQAAEASLLPFFHSLSFTQWRIPSARSLERLAEVRMAALWMGWGARDVLLVE